MNNRHLSAVSPTIAECEEQAPFVVCCGKLVFSVSLYWTKKLATIGIVSLLCLGGSSGLAWADDSNEAPNERRILVDRAVVRFSAPEGAGRARPYFIYERELAFAARLVALADPTHRLQGVPYRRHHLQNALERHVAETLLSALSIQPPPRADEISAQVQAAKKMIMQSIGGEAVLLAAAKAEGIGRLELRRYFRRRAKASIYLHVMVTPMLTPTLLELRRVHARGEGPMAARTFKKAEVALRNWFITRSLREAVTTYFRNARARVRLEFL